MNDNLPPLPEPKFQGEPKDSNGLFTHWFIEKQMREYGQLCRQQALEWVISIIPGGDSCSPQHIVDEIRSMK